MSDAPKPLSVETICNTLARSGLLAADAVRDVHGRWLRLQPGAAAADVPAFVQWLVKYKMVTSYQGDVLLRRREGPLTLGNYKIIDRIHRGRMAGVYLASTPNGQTVAAKVLPPASAANTQILARFQRKAHSITKLVHPNCIRAFEAGQDKGPITSSWSASKAIRWPTFCGAAADCPPERRFGWSIRHCKGYSTFTSKG